MKTKSWAERWSRLRRNKLGMGWLANPLVLALIADVVLYVTISIATGNWVPKVGLLFVVVGLPLVPIRGWAAGVLGVTSVTVGIVLLYLNYVSHWISF